MKPEDCCICGAVTQDGLRASWGPITLYYHAGCERQYSNAYAPRLRDALLRVIRHWVLQDPKGN